MLKHENNGTTPAEIEAIDMYWALDADGKPAHKLSKIVERGFVADQKDISPLIARASIAYSSDTVCVDCHVPLIITSRSAYTSRKTNKTFRDGEFCYLCKPCREISTRQLAEEKAEKAREVKREQAEMLKPILSAIEQSYCRGYDYSDMDNGTIFVLKAMYSLLGEKLISGFKFADCDRLADNDYNLLCDLWGKKLILPKRGSTAGLSVSSTDGCSISPEITLFTLNQSADKEPLAAVLSRVARASPIFDDKVYLVWTEYALDQVRNYLMLQTHTYRQSMPETIITQSMAVISKLLTQHSISQAWAVIFLAVKSVAALSRHQYWNVEKAVATLPNAIQKRLDLFENGEIPEYNRIQGLADTFIGLQFKNEYGYTSRSKGSQMLFLSLLNGPKENAPASVEEETNDDMFIRIGMNAQADELLDDMEYWIGEGLSLYDAFTTAVKSLPSLSAE